MRHASTSPTDSAGASWNETSFTDRIHPAAVGRSTAKLCTSSKLMAGVQRLSTGITNFSAVWVDEKPTTFTSFSPAARMAESGFLDLVMVRYNAAHRGAEREVFPVTASLGLPVSADESTCAWTCH